MDQDSFRRLLQTPRPSGSSTRVGAAQGSRTSLLANASKQKTIDSSETAFKPRKLKKQADSKYRDRAAERRVGEGNDYAHVEAIYEEFEKKAAGSQNKEEVEVQRRYLGGDSEHSILVKGLDHSLLEQNKARAALATEDDNALEEAFIQATSQTPVDVPKKRTREELIQHIKDQRARNAEQGSKTADEEARLLEEAKQKGKFKPIGFKPIGSTSEGKKKKEMRSADEVERKNKKRKVDIEVLANKASSKDNSLMLPPPVPTKAQFKPKTPEPEELIDDDFNIFADVGEYEGIDAGSDDDDEKIVQEKEEKDKSSGSMAVAPQRWIPSNETEPPPTKPSIPPLSEDVTTQPSSQKVASDEESEDERPMRLVPLSSSALPSIKDFLAMDQAADYDQKKKRKNKKKADTGDDDGDEDKKQKSVQAKVDRDYKRLKSYTDKKTAAGSK